MNLNAMLAIAVYLSFKIVSFSLVSVHFMNNNSYLIAQKSKLQITVNCQI